MTRRDRAALALALECLRGDGSLPVVEMLRALDLGGRDAQWLKWAVEERGADGDTSFPRGHLGVRLLRARLAILLRAILRADAIEREDRETGWAHDSTRTVVVCAGCGEPTNYRHGERMTILRDGRPDVCRRTGRLELARNAIPLWEQARRRES